MLLGSNRQSEFQQEAASDVEVLDLDFDSDEVVHQQQVSEHCHLLLEDAFQCFTRPSIHTEHKATLKGCLGAC